MDRMLACDIKLQSKECHDDKSQTDDEMWEDVADTMPYDFSRVLLTNYSDKFENTEVDETSPFVEVCSTPENRKIFKKTTVCWFFRPYSYKLSSDRLLRVRAPQPTKTKRKQIPKSVNTKKSRSLPRRTKIHRTKSTVNKK